MTGQRRLSQAISEGDGISLIVPARDPSSLGSAEANGAEAVLVDRDLSLIREATRLPIIWRGEGQAADDASRAGADAYFVRAASLDEEREVATEQFSAGLEQGLECVVQVESADEVAAALEQLDPEIFLLSPGQTANREEALERVLDLLEDVPAGKLAIADLPVTTREEVTELERAGVDAVIVGTTDVAGLAGAAPPQV